MIHVYLELGDTDYDAGGVIYALAYIHEESDGLGGNRAYEYEVAVYRHDWETKSAAWCMRNVLICKNATFKRLHKTIGGIIVDMDDETEDVLRSHTWTVLEKK